jgi:hypothetical protein
MSAIRSNPDVDGGTLHSRRERPAAFKNLPDFIAILAEATRVYGKIAKSSENTLRQS